MRKCATPLPILLCTIVSCLCAFIPAPYAASQASAPATVSMPKNPKELMRLAASLNGITGPDVSPWHLKITYTVFGPDGNASYQGTYDEFWISATQFKRTIVQGSSTQTDFGTPKGIFRSGAINPLSAYIDQMRGSLVVPFPSQGIDQGDFEKSKREVNGEKLICLQFSNLPTPNGPTYCIGSEQPALRVYSLGTAYEVDHSNILTFQQHYVAGDLSIVRSGNPVLKAHVDTLEPLASTDPANFTPPADATPVRRKIVISAGVAVGLMQYKPDPIYPPEAKAAKIEGTVVIQATIGTDGRLSNLTIVQGPQELQQAALDAVQTWRYRPYLLNGEPVEVQTVINVVFSLHGH